MCDVSERLHECACSAIFRSREGLNSHLAEIQIQKTYYTTQLEKCFAHSGGEEEQICDGSCVDLSATCPHDACQINATVYRSNTNLLRHFGIHVPCDEVCVFCCIPFKETHKFLRHVMECHKKETGRKAQFMRYTCEELNSLVVHELHVARHKTLSSDTNSNGKRTRVVSEISSEALDTERARKVRVMDNGHQIAQTVTPMSSSRQPTATIMGMTVDGEMSSVDIDKAMSMNSVDINGLMVTNRVELNGFGDVSSDSIYPNVGGDLNNSFFAPILQMVSGPDGYKYWSTR